MSLPHIFWRELMRRCGRPLVRGPRSASIALRFRPSRLRRLQFIMMRMLTPLLNNKTTKTMLPPQAPTRLLGCSKGPGISSNVRAKWMEHPSPPLAPSHLIGSPSTLARPPISMRASMHLPAARLSIPHPWGTRRQPQTVLLFKSCLTLSPSNSSVLYLTARHKSAASSTNRSNSTRRFIWTAFFCGIASAESAWMITFTSYKRQSAHAMRRCKGSCGATKRIVHARQSVALTQPAILFEKILRCSVSSTTECCLQMPWRRQCSIFTQKRRQRERVSSIYLSSTSRLSSKQHMKHNKGQHNCSRRLRVCLTAKISSARHMTYTAF
eukprot:m.116362 g.116362  ORF g.116362 m.116362 type:complete len:325 (+) comp9500_c1_seq2:757-1731(+)